MRICVVCVFQMYNIVNLCYAESIYVVSFNIIVYLPILKFKGNKCFLYSIRGFDFNFQSKLCVRKILTFKNVCNVH